MPTHLLCALTTLSLPQTVQQECLAKVEALIQAGLVVATVHRQGRDFSAGYAIIHQVTALGLLYAEVLGPHMLSSPGAGGDTTGPMPL
ncbi:MAG: hypothetical protein EON54_11280 [Alcaligenaceae bacterium]|nr:MAG: hypothetical protein EON54_11280 [Alcaligenaceae bacterium]